MLIKQYELEKQVNFINDQRIKEKLNNEVTVCIKTFIRPECLKRLIDSIRIFYPSIKIIIGDDSFKNQKTNRIWKNNPFKNDKNIEYYKLPYDTKAAYGRNFIISKVKTKFVFVTDDDHVFTEDTKIEHLYKALQDVPYASIAAGTVGDGNNYTLSYFKVDRKMYSLKEHLGIHNGYKSYMSLQTLYLAKVEDILKNNGYNQNLHTGQHSEFNIRMFYNGLVQLHVPSVKCLHKHPSDETHSEYNSKRKNRSLVNRYYDALGIDEVIKYDKELIASSKFFSDPITKANAYICLALAASVLNRYSKRWFISGGTLLGFIRNGDFIPHDCDIDVHYDIEDLNIKMIDEFLSMGLKLKYVFGDLDHGFEISFTYKNVKIDILCKHKFNETQYYTSYWYRGYMLQNLFNNVNATEVKYWYNIPVRVPEDCVNYLERTYGSNWKIPINTTSDPFAPRCLYIPNNLSREEFKLQYKDFVFYKKDYYRDEKTSYNYLKEILKKMINVFIINIDIDLEKWCNIKKILSLMFDSEDFIIHHFSAIKNKNGAYGCAQSHKQLLHYAKKNKMDKILVLEDDISFIFNREKTNRVLRKAIKWSAENKWDLIYLGLNIKTNEVKNFKPTKTNNKNILSGENLEWWGEFAILYNNTSYHVYDDVPNDIKKFQSHHRGDFLLDKKKNLKRYIIKPCLIDHENKFSYTHSITGAPVFRKQNQILSIRKKYKIAKLI